ncbi:MAG: hypothetical protein SFV54_10925 [Bryobacteraceae bacterium]|nr:hypothetical protein [Bryobacteraceae bacterium]
MLLRSALILLSAGVPAAPGADQNRIDAAFSRLYSFDFAGSHRILDQHLREAPEDPLGHAVRGATLLFAELDRLMILEAEFFADDKKLAEQRKLKPDPAVRARFDAAIADVQRTASARLARDPNDREALFARSLAAGLLSDYAALIDKKLLGTLTHARQSQAYAMQLLKIEPGFADAYLAGGITEYILGSLPFFVRWFVKVEGAEGNKQAAVAKLERVAAGGRYLGPFAKIILSLIHLREKRPRESERLLTQLARDYPENPLIRKELGKLSAKLRSGELVQGGTK